MINFRDEEQPFFIYAHYRNDNGQPFYIGRGKKRNREGIHSDYERAFAKKSRSQRNPFWEAVANKHGYTVEILLDNLTNDEANEKEKEFVALYKRKCDGGTLTNITIGGDGRDGVKASPELLKKMSEVCSYTLEEQMQRSLIFEPSTGCWIWNGVSTSGYPRLHWSGNSGSPDRVFYSKFRGPIPSEYHILYPNCGIEDCVNPFHMDVHSPHEAARKRGTQTRGEARYNSKLKNEDIPVIRALYKEGTPVKEIAAKFNMSIDNVRLVGKGKSWKHIPM